MINVTPDHPIAHEAYEQVKNLRCDYVNIIAHTFKKSETEQGFFIAGIYPNKGEGAATTGAGALASCVHLLPVSESFHASRR